MDLVKTVELTLEKIKQTSSTGVEYWTARELQEPLGYAQWNIFERVVKKAMRTCESVGEEIANHFVLKSKMVSVGSGAKRELIDYWMSRYGAYLVAMNGNPRLPAIATAQNYFAVQTRKQELLEQRMADTKRVQLRERVRDANKHLGLAAKNSGVQEYALFQDAGYRGLYEMGLKQIKAKKGLGEKEDLLDRAGRPELAANEFRITQTEEALKRENIKGDLNAREKHREIGAEVRKTIQKLGGTLPEDLPTEPSIKAIERKLKAKELPSSDTGQDSVK